MRDIYGIKYEYHLETIISPFQGLESIDYSLHRVSPCADVLWSFRPIPDVDNDKKFDYDPWGRRIDPSTGDYESNTTTHIIDRGYCGHEHLSFCGLINMNARMYDPMLGRFLSPDNYVQDASTVSAFNRYAYCRNNPVNFSDPTGNESREASYFLWSNYNNINNSYLSNDFAITGSYSRYMRGMNGLQTEYDFFDMFNLVNKIIGIGV